VSRALRKQAEAVSSGRKTGPLREAIRRRPWTSLGLALASGAIAALCVFRRRS
jgi:hypothetical protein